MRVCKRFYRTLHTSQLWRDFRISQNLAARSIKIGRSQKVAFFRLHRMLCLAGRRLNSVKILDRRRSDLHQIISRIWYMDLSQLKTLYIEARNVTALSSYLPNMKSLQAATILKVSRSRATPMLNLGSRNHMELPPALKVLTVTATLDRQWKDWKVTGSQEDIKILGLCQHRTFIKPV